MPESAPQGRTDLVIRHVFISYVREDSENVDWLQRKLEAAGIRVWRDTAELWPGEDWRAKIRQAIRDDALVFIACFSHRSLARDRSYQNEEILLAIEELRCRRQGDLWLIPVRFSDCDIPDLDLGAGRTLRSIQHADLFDDRADEGITRLVASMLRISARATNVSAPETRGSPVASNAHMTTADGKDGITNDRVGSNEPSVHANFLAPTNIYRQYDTHRMLVSGVPSQDFTRASQTIDAIIVPASRQAAYLDHAIGLARAAGSRLLVLCSGETRPNQVKRLLAERSFDQAVVIDLPEGYRHELLNFPSLQSLRGDLPVDCGPYISNLSTKRNLGLILARMLSWQRIFFMDDDIRDISHSNLQNATSMLKTYSSAGMRVVDFPDNSVVCHANRLTGARQDVFVSGAALAVDAYADISFFPEIYNGDWLFFYDNASGGRLGDSGCEVTQLCYYPFADPRLAASQELGDVLAEGLYGLLHLGHSVRHATRDYWTFFLEARRGLIETIIARSNMVRPEIRTQMLLAMESALDCTVQIRPELCEQYIRLWREDLQRWRRRITRLPKSASLQEALRELDLKAAELGAPPHVESNLPPPTSPARRVVNLQDLTINDMLSTWGASVARSRSPSRLGDPTA